MINFKDYRGATGYINWGDYYETQRETGEICYRCGSHITFSKGFSSCVYPSCELLNNDSGDVDGKDFIRCPKCGHQESVWDLDNHDIFKDGEHSIFCEECNFEYVVKTFVSYNFESSAMLERKE